MGRSRWIDGELWPVILAYMMPANALAVEVSLATGLRIGDVLALETSTIKRTPRPTVRDAKTGKGHRVYIPTQLRARMLAQAGTRHIFPARSGEGHRCRSAVYRDMQHAVDGLRRTGRLARTGTYSPHSARKAAAVREYHRGGLEAARKMLVHDPDHTATTLLYCLADQLPPDRRRRKSKPARSRRSDQSGQA